MYKKKSDRELIKLLEIHKSLTFESKLLLKNEIRRRDIEIDILSLENSIENKLSKIKNLDYIKDFGFQLDNQSNGLLKIERTTKSIIVDIIAIILGICFCLVGLFGLIDVFGIFFSDENINVMALVISGIKIVIGILGLSFLSGIKRLIDYYGFELSKKENIITLKKRLDINLIEIQKDHSLLELKQSSDLLTLEIDNLKILSCNSNNIVQKMTLKELFKRFKN